MDITWQGRASDGERRLVEKNAKHLSMMIDGHSRRTVSGPPRITPQHHHHLLALHSCQSITRFIEYIALLLTGIMKLFEFQMARKFEFVCKLPKVPTYLRSTYLRGNSRGAAYSPPGH